LRFGTVQDDFATSRGIEPGIALPKNITNSLHLQPTIDTHLITIEVDCNSMFLIKDKVLANRLRPEIIDTRKKTFK
jgi:hypothetical protein